MAGRHEPSEGPDDEAAEDPRDQRAEHHGSRLGPVPLRRAASAAAVQLEAPSGGRREVGRSARRRRSTSSQATRRSRSFTTSCRGASASLSVVSARSSAAVPSTFWPTTRTDQKTSWRVPEPYEVSVTVRYEVDRPAGSPKPARHSRRRTTWFPPTVVTFTANHEANRAGALTRSSAARPPPQARSRGPVFSRLVVRNVVAGVNGDRAVLPVGLTAGRAWPARVLATPPHGYGRIGGDVPERGRRGR